MSKITSKTIKQLIELLYLYLAHYLLPEKNVIVYFQPINVMLIWFSFLNLFLIFLNKINIILQKNIFSCAIKFVQYYVGVCVCVCVCVCVFT